VRRIFLLMILVAALGCNDKTCGDDDGNSGKQGYHACGLECQGKDRKAECSCSSRCPCWGKK